MSETESNGKPNSENDFARPWQSYNTVYTTAKAGMEGVDKEKVQRVVYEMSKGSKYFEHEEKKEAYMKQKIESLQAQLAKFTDSDIAHHQKIADRRIAELEATRDLSRIWLHVDMDAFYAAVETLCNPSLEGKPMAVGSMSMLSTANYEARKFGVRAAMPGFIARKLCPQLIFVPTDFKKYNHFSGLTRKVYQRYDPNFLAASLDEAYLDITDFCNDKGMTGGQVAEELRESIHKETGLTCSAGVAPNRLLAKVCSDINKPNGQFILPNERVAVVTFISSLPIRKIGGIGKVTENILKGVFGITTCEEMLQKSSFICALFSRTSADFFLSVSLGIGRTDTPQATQRKSISTERTFSPTGDETLIYQKLVDLSENLSSDMKKEGICGRTLTLKLKTSSFEVRTRAVTLPYYICSSEDILKHAKKLLKAELPVSLRLIGLRTSHFNEGREGVTVDPKQKTLANFLVADHSSRRELGTQAQPESTTRDNASAIDRDSSVYSDIHEPSESVDIFDTNQIPDSEYTFSRNFPDEAEAQETYNPPTDSFDEHVSDHDTDRAASNLPQTGESSSGLLEESSSDQMKGIIWLNDYQCSACGVELPPSFIEERQEHFDFHLAERLQHEESSNENRLIKSNSRLDRKDETSHDRQKKKQKRSPPQGKYIPIDAFFTKTSQNL